MSNQTKQRRKPDPQRERRLATAARQPGAGLLLPTEMQRRIAAGVHRVLSQVPALHEGRGLHSRCMQYACTGAEVANRLTGTQRYTPQGGALLVNRHGQTQMPDEWEYL